MIIFSAKIAVAYFESKSPFFPNFSAKLFS
jgi:hypothetical protein